MIQLKKLIDFYEQARIYCIEQGFGCQLPATKVVGLCGNMQRKS